MTNYSSIYPTLPSSWSSCGTSNCAFGGACQQNYTTSQCATGLCCGFTFKPNSNNMVNYGSNIQYYRYFYQNVSGSMVTSSADVYYQLLKPYFDDTSYCLSSTSGTSTSSYYNPSTDSGLFAYNTYYGTSAYSNYQCTQNKVLYRPNTNVFAGSIPTVNSTTCAAGQNCSIGSTCQSDSQCVIGSCCAYLLNSTTLYSLSQGATIQSLVSNQTNSNGQSQQYGVQQKSLSQWQTNEIGSYNSIFNQLYVAGRYCLSRVPGESSFTAYNQTSNYGEYVNGTNFTQKIPYSCGSWISYQSGSVLEAVSALILAAFSLAYLNLA